MKNWKTTLSGLLATVGMYFQSDGTHKVLGEIITGIGILLMGGLSADGGTKQ